MDKRPVRSIDPWGVLSQSPQGTSAEIRRALGSGDALRAARRARQALAAGGSVGAQLVLEVTDALGRRGAVGEAVELLIAALTARPGRRELEVALEEMLEQARSGEEALAVHLRAAEFYAGQSELPMSERHYLRCLEASPHSAEALVGLVQVLLSEGKPDEAEAALDRWPPEDLGTPQSYALRAAVLSESRGPGEALDVVEGGLRQFRDDSSLLSLRAQLLMRGNHPDQAESAVRQALELHPGDVGMRLVLVQLLLDRGQLDEAGALLDSLVHDVPEDAQVRYNQVRLLLLSDQPVVGAEVLARALEDGPDDAALRGLVPSAVETCMARAWDRYTADDLAGARAASEAALRLDAENVGGNALLGELDRRDGSLEAAYRRLTRAEQGDPQSGWVSGTLGQVLVGLGRPEEGLKRLRRAIELDPHLDWAAVELADSTRLRGNAREALAWALRGTSLGPENAWAWAVLGATYVQLELWEEARSALDRALGLEPAYPWALGLKASLLTSIDELDEASSTVDRAIASGPPTAWMLSLKVWALAYTSADPAEIEQVARRGLQADPADLGLVIGLGEALLQQGRTEEAQAQFRDGASQATRAEEAADAAAMADVAWCRMRLGDYHAALDGLSKALALGASAVRTRFDIALTLLCMGRPAAAVDEYETNVSLAVAERHPGRRRSYLRVAALDLTSLLETGQLHETEHVALVRRMLSNALEKAAAT